MSLHSKYSYDLPSECAVVWAALTEPAWVRDLGLSGSDFFDPCLGWFFDESMRLHVLGSAFPLDQIRDSVPPAPHWFWDDPELNGPQLLWFLWGEYRNHSQPEVGEDALRIKAFAEVRHK